MQRARLHGRSYRMRLDRARAHPNNVGIVPPSVDYKMFLLGNALEWFPEFLSSDFKVLAIASPSSRGDSYLIPRNAHGLGPMGNGKQA